MEENAGDEEEDYMSASVLEKITALEDTRRKGKQATPTELKKQRSVSLPHLLRASGLTHEILYVLLDCRCCREKRHEEQRKVPSKQTLKEKEEETRTAGLNKAIPKDNIGFQLLQKMGYK